MHPIDVERLLHSLINLNRVAIEHKSFEPSGLKQLFSYFVYLENSLVVSLQPMCRVPYVLLNSLQPVVVRRP
ncbi:hypothetical protein D9M71_415840 [compost metagenome]